MKTLKRDIVQVEDYNSFISQKGVIVDLEITGGRSSYFITPKIYGVKDERLSKNSKEFLGQHMSNGRVKLVPKELENQLRSKESMLKKRLKDISIGYKNTFVPIESFKKFELFFEQTREEYFAIRDRLVEDYITLINRFIEIARDTMVDLKAEDANNEISSIISKLPSKEDFYNSFKVEMEVSAFPNTANLDMFDDKIKDRILTSVRESDDAMIKSSLASSINEGVRALISILNSDMNRQTIHPRIKVGINNSIEKMADKNIFANSKIEEYRKDIENILDLNLDEAIAEAEVVLAFLYAYASEIKIDKEIDLEKSDLTPGVLLELYDMYK